MSKLMKLHEELDKSFIELADAIEHRKLRIDEDVLLDFIGRIDHLKTDLNLLRGTK